MDFNEGDLVKLKQNYLDIEGKHAHEQLAVEFENNTIFTSN